MKSFKIQFHDMITQIGFKICFFIVLLMAFANTFWLLLEHYGGYRGCLVDIADTSLLNGYSYLAIVFHAISLGLLTLPYSLSNVKKENRYETFHQNGTVSFRDYCLSGMLVSFLGTFAAFFIPLLISLLINGFFFKRTGVLASNFSLYDTNGAGAITGTHCIDTILNPGYCIIPVKLYIQHPQLNNLLYALLYSLVMGILALHVFQVSFYLKRKIYGIAYIYILCYILRFWLPDVIGRHYEQMYSLNFFSYLTITNNMNLHPYYMPGFVFAVLAVTWILYQCKKRRIEG